ncbi:multidrug efflux RND transporter permease subunit SmeB [Stenotrophomonas sp. C960]|uniref:multidrug efflux RND transporter permease subunit SmeB n=1 Tax=unclassified Stenotrophomonas TaxID=196198 RepID=UPI00293CB247|nr:MULTISPECIES: multidrug efflux RND transporter permease subunit SmeB [unclassified Stenotrophomonas]MDV3463812.1 multidrug efflux RND transporter permease subunit SmeB [Stenotrophomonas sp. C960]MDV3531007.1 multidrug efflux RND transporter permease subunit SmeB [Stenotrophomonas sp. C2866]
MVRFFIDRPIFAWVIAIAVSLLGLLAILILPVDRYPQIAPPTITIRATYTGASSQTVENAVTQVIEQSQQSLDHLMYMTSTSASDGSAQVNLVFATGTNPDTAQVQVQNQLQAAMATLPQAVQQNGLTITKSSGSIFEVLSFTSEDGSMDNFDVANFMEARIDDQISRVSGVGNIQPIGQEYAMRIWLDPEKMRQYALMPSDIETALQAQNTDVSAGELGGQPALKGQQLDATVTARSRLHTPEQFAQVVLKADANGSVVHLGEVAKIGLGPESYDSISTFNGKPSASLGIELNAGANAIAVSKAIDARLQQLQKYWPHGYTAHVAFTTTPFVTISLKEVVITLIEAIILVVLVMYLFLQNWRATLIPTIAVPVVLLGTFGVLAAFGYSINTLTMFALVLAIGLLVDDAIVVVENVERVMTFEGLAPKPATLKAMGQITGALVGIVLVLTAVFLPMAFFSGVTGVIYRQFSVTIAAAMILSVLVAMTITPALCGSILHQIPKGGHPHGDHGGEPSLLGKFFIWFNHRFERTSNGLRRRVDGFLGRRTLGVVFYLVLSVVTGLLLWHLPGAFLPDEDQGMLNALVKLPAGATLEQTRAVMDRLSAAAVKDDSVLSIQATAGFSVTGSGQNVGQAFIRLKDWDDRKDDADTIAVRLTKAMASVPDAQVFITSPPAILGLGDAGGFTLELQDEGGAGHAAAVAARNTLLKEAAKDPKLVNVRYASLEDAPVYAVKVDDAKAQAMGVNPQDINDTLNAALGGDFVNNFIYKGRIKKVFIQGAAEARMQPQDIERWSVRNQAGQMVPLSSLVSAHWSSAPAALQRYNGISAMEITGQPAPGVSSGEAMAEIARLADTLPEGFSHAWSDMAYQEQLSGNQAPMLYAISLLFVFLCLAALYESWAVPFAVMLAVPVGVFGAVLMMNLRGLNNDVYFQVGLLTTIGLAAKNGILIVEFARILEQQGKSTREAILQAVYLRLRPIVMTSLAFLMGVLPLVFATGAGSAARRSLGTGVAGGTVASMVLGMFFVPLFYLLVRRMFPGRAPTEATVPEARP